MNVYDRFHNATHLAAGTGVLLFAVSAGAPGLGFVGVLFVLFAWGMFSKRVESPVPRLAINAGLLVATAYMLLRIANAATEDLITIVAEYLVVLLLIKLFESRTPRDQAQSLALCGMLGGGGVLTNPGLFTGTLLIVHTFVLLVAATRFQLWAGHHETFAPPNAPSRESIGASPSQGRRTRARTAAANVLLACAIALGGIVVFVVLPRQETMRGLAFTLGGSKQRTTSGFRDHVQLGASGMITMSREVVGYATLETGGVPLTQNVSRYFRGAVLAEYTDGGKWQRSEAIKAFDTARSLGTNNRIVRGWDELPSLDEAVDEGRFPVGLYTIDQTITLTTKTADNLFTLAHPIQIAYPVNLSVALNPVDTSLWLNKVSGRQSYRVRSAPNAPSFATEEELTEYRAARAEDDETFGSGRMGTSLRALAQPLMERAGLERDFDALITPQDEQIVRLFERHLTNSYAYTIEMVAPRNRAQDPTLFFLMESRRGHCEYFASALAGMCRSVGIPARVVTGFVTSEVDTRGRYVMRQSHAHAWVEAPVLYASPVDGEEEGRVVWATFDASPAVGAQVEEPGAAGAVLATLRSWLYAVEDVWIGAVVGYDANAQRDLIGVSGDDQVNTLADLINSVIPEPSGGSGASEWLKRGVPILLGVGGVFFIVMALRGVSPLRLLFAARGGRDRRVSRIDKALRTMGHERPAHIALLDHAHAIGGDAGLALKRTADALYADRFSGASTDGVELNDAVEALERLAKTERTR